MNSFNPICYVCLKPLKNLGLNNKGFPKFRKCRCKGKPIVKIKI